MTTKVCVQGLGFVGSAMAVAVASSKLTEFEVVGVDTVGSLGSDRVDKINNGIFPFETTDKKIKSKMQECWKLRKIIATHNKDVYMKADIVVMSLPFDLSSLSGDKISAEWSYFLKAVEDVSSRISSKCLVILQSTLLPGTIVKKVIPLFEKSFKERGIDENPLIAYSYERVMPGDKYFDSIVNNYRCFAASNSVAEKRCNDFFCSFINVKDYPLTKVSKFETAEVAKIMENSFRAVNIAFIDEWAQFAEEINVDLSEAISAIRYRETHRNLASPGFGVGGYCLTKDPLFGIQSAKELYNLSDHKFPFSKLAVDTNRRMTDRALNRLKECLVTLDKKRILLVGVSYKSDIGDTRHSPSISFYKKAIEQGALLTLTDPFLRYCDELKSDVENDINKVDLNKFDAIVFAVLHKKYDNKIFREKLLNLDKSVFLFDACNLFQRLNLSKDCIKNSIFVIGKGKD